MEQYLVLVYAGLTGSVTMITCTILALTRLVFEYKGRTASFIHSLICVFKYKTEFNPLLSIPRLNRSIHHGAAAAQCLSPARSSYQGDS